MRGRYYDSATARFLSPDPIFLPGPLDVNPYQYAHNDPFGTVDPLGTQSIAAAATNRSLRYGMDATDTAVGNAVQQVGDFTSSAFSSLRQYTPEAGSAFDGPGTFAFGTGFVSKGLSGHADDITSAATKALEKALPGIGTANPATTIVTDGAAFGSYNTASQYANGLKQTGEFVDALGKFADVAKEGIKLNDSIIAAQKEQATNASATDLAEASFLKDLRSLYKAGKLSGKDYIAQARAYISATNETRTAGLSALVIDEWIAGAKFTQNCLVSLASSGVTKGKFAKKKVFAAAATLGKGVLALGTWVGSVWSGTNVNAK